MSEAYTLALLEFVIQSNGRVRSDHLWTFMCRRFGNTADFFAIVGSTASDLEQFIRLQPAVFRLRNHYVYLSDEGDDPHSPTIPSGLSSNVTSCPTQDRQFGKSTPRSSAETDMEAVRYFQELLLRKCDRWMHIKSLAGHLSQATPVVRMLVGPQSEFYNFLRRHPSVFRIQGDLVCLCDHVRSMPDSSLQSLRKKPYPLPLTGMDTPSELSPSNCFRLPLIIEHSSVSKDDARKFNTMVLSIDECKGALWLLHKIECLRTSTVSTSSLLAMISRAPKCVSCSIGRTKIELMAFIRKYDTLFVTDEHVENVAVHATQNMNLVVVMRGGDTGKSTVLLAQKGSVYCVNKLWGILDLGFHEHVFFDRSLFKHVTDLSKHFQVRETVLFNAVLASKGSRAKWRATCVWKETDPLPNHLRIPPSKELDLEDALDDPDSGLESSEDQTGHKLPLRHLFVDISEAYDYCSDKFASIRVSYAWELDFDISSRLSGQHNAKNLPTELNNGCLKVDQDESVSSRSSPVSELSTLSGIPSIPGCSETYIGDAYFLCSSSGLTKTTTSSVATQTLFTGEIMATKLYHDDVGKLV